MRFETALIPKPPLGHWPQHTVSLKDQSARTYHCFAKQIPFGGSASWECLALGG